MRLAPGSAITRKDAEHVLAGAVIGWVSSLLVVLVLPSVEGRAALFWMFLAGYPAAFFFVGIAVAAFLDWRERQRAESPNS